MKNVLISATLSATLGLSAFSSLAQDVDLRMSWWGGNGRHQVTLKALEEFHKQTQTSTSKQNTPAGTAIFHA